MDLHRETLGKKNEREKRKTWNTWFGQIFLSAEEAGFKAIWSTAMFRPSFSPLLSPEGHTGPGWQQIAADPALPSSWDFRLQPTQHCHHPGICSPATGLWLLRVSICRLSFWPSQIVFFKKAISMTLLSPVTRLFKILSVLKNVFNKLNLFPTKPGQTNKQIILPCDWKRNCCLSTFSGVST